MSDLTKQQIRKYKIDKTKLIKSRKHSMYVHEDILISGKCNQDDHTQN